MVVAGTGDRNVSGGVAPLDAGLIPSLRRSSSRGMRFDHIVMVAAVVCLIVLVVLPICSLFIGAVTSDGMLTP